MGYVPHLENSMESHGILIRDRLYGMPMFVLRQTLLDRWHLPIYSSLLLHACHRSAPDWALDEVSEPLSLADGGGAGDVAAGHQGGGEGSGGIVPIEAAADAFLARCGCRLLFEQRGVDQGYSALSGRHLPSDHLDPRSLKSQACSSPSARPNVLIFPLPFPRYLDQQSPSPSPS